MRNVKILPRLVDQVDLKSGIVKYSEEGIVLSDASIVRELVADMMSAKILCSNDDMKLSNEIHHVIATKANGAKIKITKFDQYQRNCFEPKTHENIVDIKLLENLLKNTKPIISGKHHILEWKAGCNHRLYSMKSPFDNDVSNLTYPEVEALCSLYSNEREIECVLPSAQNILYAAFEDESEISQRLKNGSIYTSHGVYCDNNQMAGITVDGFLEGWFRPFSTRISARDNMHYVIFEEL
ncbi:MAG: hypothetical protein PHU12_02735 [Candidatus Aenigmarchaeota archaeon]|nr:hypothetical protein [Candidatus Aenigmarchaeota archaeon]